MSDEQPVVEKPKSEFMQALTGIASDVFEEAKILFYVTVLISMLELVACHFLKEMGVYAGILTGTWAGFTALIGKMAFGKNG